MRPISKIAPEWWDYITLDPEILDEAANLTEGDLLKLGRDGFAVKFYDTAQDFFLAEAMEYINAWRQATKEHPAGICGPIGPVNQLPLVARLVNELGLDLKYSHFWGMDEWVVNGKEVGIESPLSFARADTELCFNRIDKRLRMAAANLHFPKADTKEYADSWKKAHCVIMQGGQGDVKHWAFNEPPRRAGKYAHDPPSPEEYRRHGTRVIDLHPLTLIQNARSSASGMIHKVASQAVTVGPLETWQADKISIWHPGTDDNPFGMRLTTLMISKRIPDASVPMSLLADHPNVQFNFLRSAIGACEMKIF